MPVVESTDAFWAAKHREPAAAADRSKGYDTIHLPSSNPTGIFLAFVAVIYGFAMIWHIYWLAIAGLIGGLLVGLIQAWRPEREIEITPQEIVAYESRVAGGVA
jgi:cytochrome o ubiquinol oxidase subunit 1